MLNSETVGVTHKFLGGEGSQEDVGWLLNGQVKASLGLLSHELFDFVDHLDAVFNWHLEV